MPKTSISPSVSAARKSTRVTLTTFAPAASGTDLRSISSETVPVPGTVPITRVTNTAKIPATAAIAAFQGEKVDRPANSIGRIRRASANMATIKVSTRSWVRATSGAPAMAKRADIPYPSAPRRSTATILLLTDSSPPAVKTINTTTTHSLTDPDSSGEGKTSKRTRAGKGSATATRMICPR